MRKAVAYLQDDKNMIFEMNGYEVFSGLSEIAGGDGENPSPGVYFISALVNCALSSLVTFCKQREISTEGIKIEFTGKVDEGIYQSMSYDVTLPVGFPDKYKDSAKKIIDQCTIKRYAKNLPEIQYNIQ